MKRHFTALVALLVIFTTPASTQSPWTAVAERLTPSVYFLEAVDADDVVTSSCSGFGINVEKKYILTAAHCDGHKVRIDGTPSYKIFKDERKDLMVLRGTLDMGPALKLARENPAIGTSVASMGFGFGLEQPMFRVGNVSHARIEIEELSGPFVMIDANYIGGQSGGPVVNVAGELVSIVQRGAAGLGFGVGADTLRDKVGKYFE